MTYGEAELETSCGELLCLTNTHTAVDPHSLFIRVRSIMKLKSKERERGDEVSTVGHLVGLTFISWSKVAPSPLARHVEKTAALRSAGRDDVPAQCSANRF